jgi:hypothetical protein
VRTPDVAIVEMLLPNGKGVDLCRQLRPFDAEFHAFVHAGPIFSTPIACRVGETREAGGFVFCHVLTADASLGCRRIWTTQGSQEAPEETAGVTKTQHSRDGSGPKAARVRSGFVPETRAKSAEFAGIPFSSLRRRQRRNILDLQAKDRLDEASSAACHAEGRGFESLQPLVVKALQSEGFSLLQRRGQVVIRAALPRGATKPSILARRLVHRGEERYQPALGFCAPV